MDALSYIDPVELTEFARLAQADFDAQSQSLARFFPVREVTHPRRTSGHHSGGRGFWHGP